MARGRSTVRVHGVDEVLRRLGEEGAREMVDKIDEVVERRTLMMVNDAKIGAPIDTGLLKNSIHLYGRQMKMSRVFGSNVEYATKQEYTHATKKGFFRKAVWNHREKLREDVREVIRNQ